MILKHRENNGTGEICKQTPTSGNRLTWDVLAPNPDQSLKQQEVCPYVSHVIYNQDVWVKKYFTSEQLSTFSNMLHERHGVFNRPQFECLFNRMFRLTTNENQNYILLSFCVYVSQWWGNVGSINDRWIPHDPPHTGPVMRNTFYMPWRHHDLVMATFNLHISYITHITMTS